MYIAPRMFFFVKVMIYIRLNLKQNNIMAKAKGKFFKGSVGPVVFKELNDQQVVCSKPAPGKMKQTEATKKAAGIFGMSSKLQNLVKEIFNRDLIDFHDKSFQPRLIKELNPILHQSRNADNGEYHFEEDSFKNLMNFEFNINSQLKDRLPIKPRITHEDNKLAVRFPDWETAGRLKFKRGEEYGMLTVSVALFRLKDGLQIKVPLRQTIRLDKDIDDHLNGRQLLFDVPEDCLCVVSMFLKYYNEYRLLNHKDMSPAAIIDAVVTKGTYQETDNYQWTSMGIKFN